MWPAFAPERIEHLDSSIAELTRRHVDGWPTGRPCRVLEATRTLCTDITVRLVLGINDEPRRGELVRAIRALLNIPGNPPLPLPGTGDGPAGTAGRAGDRLFARRSREVRGLLADELHERRARAQPGDDVLGAMVSSAPALSDAEIIDELLIVLMAAQEPPGIALANVVYELGRRPEVAERFLTDAAARRAIIAEVIRLRPSASAALRTLREPMSVDGTTLPAGATVACPSPLVHRDPRWFPDPDGFRAERFAHGAPAHAPYFPFGGGARRCIGEALAEAEFRAALPVVLERLRFKRVWPREERMVVRATVLVPHRSALMQARRR
jgi:cytochrome P450